MAVAQVTLSRRDAAVRRAASPWVLAWLVLLPYAVLRAATFAESDTFWEIRTGVLILQRQAIPSRDPFSWTAAGHHWTLNSWGFDVVAGAAYRLGGLAAVGVLTLALVAAVLGLVLAVAKRLGARPSVAGIVLVLALPLLTPYLSARPQILDYLAVLVLAVLLREIVDGRPRPALVAAGAVLTAVWVNLHAGALLGIGMIVATGALCALDAGRRARVPWLVAVAAAAAAGALLNPYGAGLLGQTSGVMSSSTALVAEWRHPDITNPLHVLSLLGGAYGLVLAVRRRDAVSTACLAVAMLGALTAVRMLPIVLVLAVPVVAASLSTGVVVRWLDRAWTAVLVGVAIVAGSATLLAAGALPHLGEPAAAVYPAHALDHVPAGCHVFNSYLFGGLLILERPDVKVSVDSRNDLYGRAMIDDHLRTYNGHGDPAVDLRGAGCVLVPPSSGLARQLGRTPGWTSTYREHGAQVFVRTS